MAISIAVSHFLRQTWELLVSDTQGAYTRIIQRRYILVPFVVICLLEIMAGVLTAHQQAADAVSSLLSDPFVSQSTSINEQVAYEISRPTAWLLAKGSMWRVFWISTEIATTTLGLLVAGMAVGRLPAVWETVAVVTNARLIPATVGKLVEVPFAWYLGSVFYAQISLGPLFVELDSVRPIHHILFQVNLFYIWRTISMAEGMSILWRMNFRSSFLIVFGVWLLKVLLTTTYIGIAFGG